MLSETNQPFPLENETLEYKDYCKTKGRKHILHSSLKREICAFLNNNIINNKKKSFIYLGVDDKTRTISRRYTVREKQRFSMTINNWAEKSFNPSAISFIHIHAENTPFCIEVDSPRFVPFMTIVGKHAHPELDVRVGTSSQKATFGEARKLLIESHPKNYDIEPSYNQDLRFKYLKYTLQKIHKPFHLKGISEFYTSNDEWTNTALLFSDNNPFITKLAYNTTNTKFIPKIFHGSIAKQINEILDYINFNFNNEKSTIGSIKRNGVFDYPKVAIREAVINTFAHRLYYSTEEFSTINIYKDRMEISSPGALPDGLKPKAVLNHHSDARNPRVLEFLHFLGYAEQYGSGFPRIRTAYKQESSSQMRLQQTSNDVTIILPNINYKHKSNSKALVLPDGFITLTNNSYYKILNYMKINKYITHGIVQKLCDVKSSQASRLLLKLQQDKLIRKHGRGRGTYYKLIAH